MKDIFKNSTAEGARKKMNEVANDYREIAPNSVNILETGFEDVLTVYNLPEEMRIALRTSNCIERLNGELKRRSNVIRIFPNKASILRLMGAVAIDYNDALLSKRMMFHRSSPEKVTVEVKIKLQEIALLQKQFLEAA